MTSSDARPSDVLWFLLFFVLCTSSWVALAVFYHRMQRGIRSASTLRLAPSPDQFPLEVKKPCHFFRRPPHNDPPRGPTAPCRRALRVF